MFTATGVIILVAVPVVMILGARAMKEPRWPWTMLRIFRKR